ncbi:AAA family ATPase [Pseudanabaena minima]|uniref:AAA family ATPase n=1 Tax=Pseudanabaena minima TaxID=890415 RepID=UPI003DAA2F4F
MLIEFNVENYRSFRDEANFSMVAAKIVSKDKKLDQENIIQVDSKLSLLKSAVIYGANASGKSNLHAALRFMRWFVLNSSKESQEGELIAIEPFRLSTETEQQSSVFEIIFILNKRKYRYGFEVTTQEVISEWLFDVPSTRERKLFIRENNQIDVKKSFSEGIGLEIRTRANALFLSVVSQWNGKTAKEILHWFNTLSIAEPNANDGRNRRYTIKCFEDGLYKPEIIEFIKKLDLGISGIEIEPDFSMVPQVLQDRLTEESLKVLGRKSVKTLHWKYSQDGGKSPVFFDLDANESEGTRRLFALAGLLIDTLKQGKILFIDEFDSSIHPLITCAVINLFNSKDTNPKNAQIIFITHDTNLLSHKIFRRDQVWFAEKDEQGSTHLYSLAEYKIPTEEDSKEDTFKKVRNDASFEDNYIHGKYGAIPFIGNLQSLLGNSNG